MNDLPIWVTVSAGIAGAVAFWMTMTTVVRLARHYRDRFTHGVSRQLTSAFLYVSVGRLLALNLAIAVLAALSGLVLGGNALVAAGAALVSGLLPRGVLWWIRRQRIAAFRAQLSDLLMLTAGGLRSGVSLSQAFGQTASEIGAPARQEVELMLREQRLGATFEQALAGLERRMPLEETALLCAALRISRESGGNLAETLESLGDAIRRKVTVEGKIRALTAQGRLQAIAMALLPVLCGVLLAVVEPDAMGALFTTWYGLAACAFVLTMQLLGAWFLRRVMRIDV